MKKQKPRKQKSDAAKHERLLTNLNPDIKTTYFRWPTQRVCQSCHQPICESQRPCLFWYQTHKFQRCWRPLQCRNHAHKLHWRLAFRPISQTRAIRVLVRCVHTLPSPCRPNRRCSKTWPWQKCDCWPPSRRHTLQTKKGSHAHTGPFWMFLWTVCAFVVSRHGLNNSVVGRGHLRHGGWFLFCLTAILISVFFFGRGVFQLGLSRLKGNATKPLVINLLNISLYTF